MRGRIPSPHGLDRLKEKTSTAENNSKQMICVVVVLVTTATSGIEIVNRKANSYSVR